MRIIIPTFRRYNAQETLKALPRSWQAETTLVVDQYDAEKLQRFPGFYGCDLMVVPKEIKTIAQKRKFILETVPYTRILMLDDDLRFAARHYDAGVKLYPATHDDIHCMFMQVFAMLDDLAHVGISPRQGNNRNLEDCAINTRMIYALGYNIPIIKRECELGRIETREDMDYTLQLLRKGFGNIVYFNLCVDQKYNSPGGASKERTIESSNADAEKLAALHPGFVRITEKKYKASVPRKEVVCSWKKAFASAQQ